MIQGQMRMGDGGGAVVEVGACRLPLFLSSVGGVQTTGMLEPVRRRSLCISERIA